MAAVESAGVSITTCSKAAVGAGTRVATLKTTAGVSSNKAKTR